MPSEFRAAIEDLEILWNPLDPSASENAFRTFLPAAEHLSGKDRGYLIELLCMIARAQSLQHQIPQAQALLKRAEQLLNEPQAEFHVSARIRWLLETGRLHILEKTPSQARILFAEAWPLAINAGEDYLAVEIAQMLALVEPQKIRDKWLVRAIEIAEASLTQKAKRWLGGLYTRSGWHLYDLRQYEKALAAFQKALSHLKIHGTAREAAAAKWATGKVLRAMGRVEKALVIQQELFAEFQASGIRDGRLYEELAECLQSLQRTEEAQVYFEMAYQVFSQDTWVTDNQPLKLKRMKDLGKAK